MLGAAERCWALRERPLGEAVQVAHPSCDTPAQVVTYGEERARLALVSLSCCDETKNALLVGVEEPNGRADQTRQEHLQPLQDRLTSRQAPGVLLHDLGPHSVQALISSLPTSLKMAFKWTTRRLSRK